MSTDSHPDKSAPDGGPVADFALPDALGLCPDHGGEFYMPLELPFSTFRCPVQDCDRLLVLYTPAARNVSSRSPGRPAA